MNNAHREIYHFFDQNVMDKISKRETYNPAFHKNFKQTLMKPDVNQALTPFFLLEFAGIKARDIIKIFYKGKPFNEYPCKYEELNKITKFLIETIKTKVTKCFLIHELSEKKKHKKHFNNVGIAIIDEYIKSIKEDKHYENLIHNLYLDRLPQINTSEFSKEEKEDFNRKHFYPSVMRNVCYKNRTVGSFRAIKQIDLDFCQNIKKQFPKDTKLKQDSKAMAQVSENLKLKLYGDLVDCELIHLAFFGYQGDYCHCYTADREDIIKKRLDFYCNGVYFMERWFYDYLPKTRPEWKPYCEKYFPQQRPEWKCGKVFILDKETGEQIKKISVTKIYDNIKTCIDSELSL